MSVLNNIQQEIESTFKKNLIDQINDYVDYYKKIHGDINDELIIALYGFVNFVDLNSKNNRKVEVKDGDKQSNTIRNMER